MSTPEAMKFQNSFYYKLPSFMKGKTNKKLGQQF